jgi:hypothetical protein
MIADWKLHYYMSNHLNGQCIVACLFLVQHSANVYAAKPPTCMVKAVLEQYQRF